MRPGPGDVIDSYDLAFVWSVCAVAALLIHGCGAHEPEAVLTEPLPPQDGGLLYWSTAPPFALPPAPVVTSDLRWADVEADRLDDVQRQWIPEGTRGLPPGWTAESVPQDPFYDPLAGCEVHGVTYLHARHIRVAATPNDRQGRAHAALSHELSHAWIFHITGDADLASRAGHR